jgi:UDP-N-acetylmuramoyl-tripeptide--D-alanyl-D-alanine ligase
MDVQAHICIPGNHMVYNALAGASIGEYLGLTAEEIAAGIRALVPVSGRNRLIETDTLQIIDDCYNANPISMKASLDVLSFGLGRRVAILGDMFELGEDEKELHASVGTYAAKKGIECICCVGELSEYTAKAAKEAASPDTEVLHFATRDAFLAQMSSVIRPDDTILVKASHGMEFPKIVEELQKIRR